MNFPMLLDDAELALILAGDDLAELDELHDRLTEQLGAVEARIRELIEDRGNPEERELRQDYLESR